MEKIKQWFGELSIGGKVFVIAAIVAIGVSIIQQIGTA
jgi:hypothetical protein